MNVWKMSDEERKAIKGVILRGIKKYTMNIEIKITF